MQYMPSCVGLCGADVVYWQLSDLTRLMGIAQIVAHAAAESILCHEGWRRGSFQISLGRICGSSCLDIGRIIGSFHFCIVPMGTLGVKNSPDRGLRSSPDLDPDLG